jgi:hypothetical protein
LPVLEGAGGWQQRKTPATWGGFLRAGHRKPGDHGAINAKSAGSVAATTSNSNPVFALSRARSVSWYWA